jgi:hypothetical protein
MREDGKIARTVYTGAGVKSIEWIDPPKKKVDQKADEPKREEEEED